MHPSYRQFGFTEADASYVAAFEKWARKQGWPRDQIEAAYAWYADQPRDSDRDNLIDSFSAFSDAQGWSSDARDAALVWHDTVVEHGSEAILPEEHTAPRDLESLDDIRRVMQEDPERYWSDSDMQRVHHDALERQASRSAVAKSIPSADQQRRGEIERLMRDDSRTYWRDEQLQNEYAAILAREYRVPDEH